MANVLPPGAALTAVTPRALQAAGGGGGAPAQQPRRRPHVLLAASGSVAAIKFATIAQSLAEWGEVRAVCTRAAGHFIARRDLPAGVELYTDEEEWSAWSKLGDSVLHIELRRWADVLVIAPLSANTLAKIAGGLCDNLLTCIIRAWDFSRPLLVAPAMNTFMWNSPFTARHLAEIDALGVQLVPPISKRLACGDIGNGAMAEPATIEASVREVLVNRTLLGDAEVAL